MQHLQGQERADSDTAGCASPKGRSRAGCWEAAAGGGGCSRVASNSIRIFVQRSWEATGGHEQGTLDAPSE